MIRPGTVEGYEAVTLAAGPLEATFVPAAGMVGASLRHAGEELLATRYGVATYEALGKTMGIPFLHPWANRLDGAVYEVAGRRARIPAHSPLVPRDEHGLPIHGLLVGMGRWRVEETAEPGGEAELRATMDFPGHEGFPFPHRVEHHISLDEEALQIRTVMRAADDAPLPVSVGFHPYVRLPGVPRAEWVMSLPARRRIIADGRGIPTGARAAEPAEHGPLGGRTFDDGYDGLGERPSFSVAGGGRRVTVTLLEGYRVAQVFAPPDQDVVCFEPMTAPTNALVTGEALPVVDAGGSYEAAFELRAVADGR